jgi:hypothetical protein
VPNLEANCAGAPAQKQAESWLALHIRSYGESE